MTSQAVKIRDRRRLPFVMVTKVALEAIRDGFDARGRPMALAVYVSIVECANDVRSDVFEASRESIVRRGRYELKALEKYVPELQRLGLLQVESGVGRPNQWTLTDPGTPLEGAPLERGTDQQGATTLNGAAPTPLEGAPRLIGSKKEKNSSTPDGVEPERASTVDPATLPTDFPPELTAAANTALEILQRVQAERGGNTPTLRAVGLAVRRYPDRDHAQAAAELEHWATVGRGQNRRVRDWARQYAAFLDQLPAGAAPRAATGGTARSERRARRSAALENLMSETGAAA